MNNKKYDFDNLYLCSKDIELNILPTNVILIDNMDNNNENLLKNKRKHENDANGDCDSNESIKIGLKTINFTEGSDLISDLEEFNKCKSKTKISIKVISLIKI